jgi:hypothetical protein
VEGMMVGHHHVESWELDRVCKQTLLQLHCVMNAVVDAAMQVTAGSVSCFL